MSERQLELHESRPIQVAPNSKFKFIDLFAGIDGSGVMLYTASHELTHHIKNVSPEKFDLFADALLDEYTKNGYSLAELIAAKKERLESAGRISSDMTEEQIYDLAHEEIVADAWTWHSSRPDGYNK